MVFTAKALPILGFQSGKKSFPTEGWLPASLQSLQLSYFPNLETLDCKGLQHLTSLQELSILLCPKLENITQQNLPASISKLFIYGKCPLTSKLQEMNDPRIQIEKLTQTRRMSLIDSDLPPILQGFAVY
ncbi:hypothetical protein PIB30_011891 [Stylosanthes scabra]|uniref:CC-NBS-LRR protein n=1 Tax=Stylosanthes scabra TaxID=79078 RepID=A0ABU6V6A5_9FABA|nr:hypothetical protein [Stylosanthes scabra]